MGLKEMLKRDKIIEQYYKDGELWYRTRSGLEYPAPRVDQRGEAAYLAQEKMFQFIR